MFLFTHKKGRKLKVWFKYSRLRTSDWRNCSNLELENSSELRYSNPRIPARPENSAALSRFLYPMIHLKPAFQWRLIFSNKQPVKVRDIRVMYRVGDIFECLGIDLLVPIEDLFNVFATFLDLCPSKQWFSLHGMAISSHLKRECWIWNLSFVLK